MDPVTLRVLARYLRGPVSLSAMFTTHPNDPREARGLQALGYWRPNLVTGGDDLSEYIKKLNEKYAYLPDPRDFIDNAWDLTEKTVVAGYLKTRADLVSWRGWSSCRLCGIANGSTCKSDGKFVWPSGFAHYVEAHSVRPPAEFIKHILAV